jgi:hypothetical protein
MNVNVNMNLNLNMDVDMNMDGDLGQQIGAGQKSVTTFSTPGGKAFAH